jgi:hypothetical protein
MDSMRVKTLILLAGFLALTITGCGDSGPELGEVHGRVTVDGQPEANVVVMFDPGGEGRASFGMTDEQGYYELGYAGERMGALIGPHTVRIRRETMDENDEPLPGVVQLPDRYNENSELTAEVEAGSNEFDFQLQTQG